MWITNAMLGYYAGNAEIGNKILSSPAHINEHIFVPMRDFFTYMLSCYICLWQHVVSFVKLIFSTPSFILLSIKYWMIRSKLWMRYMKLSWLWWLYMISVLWYHKPPEPKQVHGTYWMLWRADMYQLKREFKDLKRFRKDIGDSCFDTALYFLITFFVLHLPMLILNAIATSYLVCRIFAFRLGIIKCQPTEKKNGWCKRRRSKWKRGSTRKKGWRKRRSSKWKSSSKYHAHAIVLNIDDKVGGSASVRFDADSVTVVCDNSANVHVCNDKNCFVGEIKLDNDLQVATIGGKENTSAGIGTVRWKWKDDEGVFHTFEIRDVLYFPESPVNILSVTKFADQLNDDEGTGIDTKRNHSVLYWNEKKFQRTIRHPASNLPENASQ